MMIYLDDFYMANIELGDGLGPHTDTNLLGWRGVLLNQHLPQVLIDLHKQIGIGECRDWRVTYLGTSSCKHCNADNSSFL